MEVCGVASVGGSTSTPGFKVAPSVEGISEGSIVPFLQNYIAFAKDYSSAAKVGNKWVVFVYGGRYNGDAAFWNRVKAAVAQAGIEVFWAVDLSTDSHSGFNHRPGVEPLVPLFDAP